MDAIMKVQHVSKSFMNNNVLKDISLELCSGECLALVGENGAGKSTLMKIITGIYKKDEGEIEIHGRKTEINSPIDAQRAGIAIIHQELNLISNLSVAQNIFLGREKQRYVQIDEKTIYKETKSLLTE